MLGGIAKHPIAKYRTLLLNGFKPYRRARPLPFRQAFGGFVDPGPSSPERSLHALPIALDHLEIVVAAFPTGAPLKPNVESLGPFGLARRSLDRVAPIPIRLARREQLHGVWGGRDRGAQDR